jgi:ribosomal-protein-alanine N-acetyltransferase
MRIDDGKTAVNQRPSIIETERLRLIVLLPDEIEALIANDTERASLLTGVVFPPGWPDEAEAREGLPWHLRNLIADSREVPWRIRVIVERFSAAVIGSINLKGPPSDTGDVEIGWGIIAAHRRYGYALEATGAVVIWVSSQAGVKTVSATIPDNNVPSQRLSSKVGMTRTNELRRGLPLWRMTVTA